VEEELRSIFMKAKSASSAPKTLEEKLEISEQTFLYTLLKIANDYKILAYSNMHLIDEVKQLQEMGYKIKFYEKNGHLTYEAREPERIGF
jgi:pyruvate-formate lyase